MSELERYDPSLSGRIKYEHFHRYALACDQVAGLRVLDIASGDGYGSSMLAAHASSVHGVDVDGPSVEAANKRYGRPGQLEFLQGDASSIPFSDSHFDVVVSFETIEHVRDPEALAKELKRVLKPNGVLIISSPNKSIYNRGRTTSNPFHPSEMELEEFTDLVKRHFKHVGVLGQRMIVASAIGPIDGETPPNAADYRGYTVIEDAVGRPMTTPGIVRLPDPEYVICLASNQPLVRAASPDSLFLTATDDLWHEQSDVLTWASTLHEEDEALRQALQSSRGDKDELESARRQLEAQELELKGLAGQGAGALSIVAALASDISGSTVTADLASLVRSLGQAGVRLAVQDLRLEQSEAARTKALESEADARVKAVQAANDAEAARLLATEMRMKADQSDAQRALSEHDLTAARNVADEALSQAQALGIHLEKARIAEDAARRALEQKDQELRQVSEEFDAIARLSLALKDDVRSLTERLESETTDRRTAHDVEIAALRIKDEELRQVREEFEAIARLSLALKDDVESLAERLESETTELRSAHDVEHAALRIEAENLRAELLVRSEETSAEARRHQLRDTEQQQGTDALERLLLRQQDELEEQKRSQAFSARDAVATAVAANASHEIATWGVASVKTVEARKRDAAFASALRQRLQQSVVDQVGQYRSALSAATTVQSVQNHLATELRGATSEVAGTLLTPVVGALDRGSVQRGRASRRLKRTIRSALRPTRAPAVDPVALAALFDPLHYLSINNVKLAPGQTAYDHYLEAGRRKGFSTHPLIDTRWIQSQGLKGQNDHFDLFSFIADPALHDLAPHPLFDAAHYRTVHPDIAAAGVNPLAHYLVYGWLEGRSPNRLFDNHWYLAANADVRASGMNPLAHYAQFGAAEGRQPHPLFNAAFYTELYPDVALSGMDPYTHFIVYGRNEGRLPSRRVQDLGWLAGYFSDLPLIDLIDGPDPHSRLKPVGDVFWPPLPTGDYWLPQGLRNYIIDRFGEAELDLYIYLFSLIDRHADAPDLFDDSEDAHRLVTRARQLAAVSIDGRPAASIVIPVYNNLLYTLTCIVSILESAPSHAFEIIVADDQSSDRTAELVGAIGGLVRHVRNPTNLGFLENCNAAAAKAAGDVIVLLNNDTIVFPGWLDNLVEGLAAAEDIGLIGSKLLNGDGTLQEAGGIFWDDGSAWNYGRDDDALLPEYNYLKSVDYISGASIAVPAPLWRQLGGFDSLFAPAYCEDSDLAFRVRQAGFKTIYHPHSSLVHHEGRSHGRDEATGVKAYQAINQKKFFKRWRETLTRENFPNGSDLFLARDRSRARPHIVIIDHYVPQWDQDAGSRTMFHFIRAFANRGFQITFWPDNLNEDRTYAEELQKMGVEVIYGYQYSGGFEDWLGINSRYIDYALLSRPHIGERYIDALNDADLKVVFYGHDLHCLRARSAYALSGDRDDKLQADLWESREVDISSRSNVVMYPGFEETAFIAERVPAGVTVIRPPITIFDEAELALADSRIIAGGSVDPYALMFVGGFAHSPNGDGIGWFLDSVWPRLRQADERFTLSIGGSRMPESLLNRSEPGVRMLGRLSDAELATLYATSGIAIVPLRFGGGIKGKVIEAFAKGVPVVMTDIGAQGLPDADKMGAVTTADESFGDAILDAARNRDQALQRALRAVDFLRSHYSEQAFCDLLAPEIPELAPAQAQR